MAECIYCGKRDSISSEHYLPVCLGRFRNLEPLQDKLCSKCNSKIGLLEEQFCRCGPEAFFRILFGIKGRSHHKKPSPFYRGSAGGKYIVTTTKHPTRDCDIYCEMEEGSENTFPARQVIFEDQEGKLHPILITDSMKTSDDLEKAIQKKGIVNGKPVECWTASPDEQGWIEELLGRFKTQFSWNETLSFEKDVIGDGY